MFNTALLGLAALVGLVVAQEPTSWIDVNPAFAKETYVTVKGSSTIYIGPTNEVLSVSTATATVSNKLETVTTSLKYVVQTATLPAGDHAAGDIGIELTPDLSQSLTDIAVQKCGSLSKKVKREAAFTSCALKFAEAATSGDSAPLGAIGAPTLPSTIGGAIGDIIAAGRASGLITGSNAGIYALALIALEGFYANVASGKSAKVPLNLILPAAALRPTATPTISSTSTSSCPAQNSGESPPDCGDKTKCNGDANNVCQTGTFKGCPCEEYVIPIAHQGSIDLDAQQDILSSWAVLIASSTGAALSAAPSPTSKAVCDKSSQISLAPSSANALAEFFCDNTDLSKDASRMVSGTDLTNNTSIATGIIGTFNFRKYGVNCAVAVQHCIGDYITLISECQSDNLLTGGGYISADCGIYSLTITKALSVSSSTCSGPTTEGNDECTTYCMGKTGRSGVCVHSGTGNTCSCS